MKEPGRRSLSLLLAAVLVFGLFSGAIPVVFAAGESEVFSVASGKVTLTQDEDTGYYTAEQPNSDVSKWTINPVVRLHDVPFTTGTVEMTYVDKGVDGHPSNFCLILN